MLKIIKMDVEQEENTEVITGSKQDHLVEFAKDLIKQGYNSNEIAKLVQIEQRRIDSLYVKEG